MLRLDIQRDVLIDDLRDESAKLFELVDMARVHQHTVGQRTRLRAACLVGLIEQWPYFGMLVHEHLVEVRGQRLASAFEKGNRCFYDGAVFGGEHIYIPV
jgi:hypothetical protein